MEKGGFEHKTVMVRGWQLGDLCTRDVVVVLLYMSFRSWLTICHAKEASVIACPFFTSNFMPSQK